jgi:hypothetical protein
MKFRNGFVSNSSASSFIIGIARVKDFDKFNKIKDTYGIDILGKYNGKENKAHFDINNETDIGMEAFDYTSVTIEKELLNDGDTIVSFYASTDIDCNEDNYYEYESFPKAEKLEEVITEENGLDLIDIACGAGYNG